MKNNGICTSYFTSEKWVSQFGRQENSGHFLTVKTGLVFGGIVKLGLQYDQISGSRGINVFGGVPPGQALPDKNITVNAAVYIAPLIFGKGK